MVIANPIYDVVFKRLMENKRVARFFIETLLEETVEEVEVKPQEFTYTDQLIGLAIFRLDFIATIKTDSGEFKKVLIEIRKAKNSIDLMRFRRYLGEQYKTEDEIHTPHGLQKTALPIVTIYLLGFQLPGIESPAVKVARNYTDLITHTVIIQKSEFIEKLTHDCFIVQMSRIHGKLHTRLEKVLGIFEQNYFIDGNGIIKEYNYEIDDDNIRNMIEILHYAGTDPMRKKEIEDEQEAWRVVDAVGGEKMKVLAWKIEQKEKVIEQKEQVIEQKEKVIEQKEKVIEQKEKVIEQKDKTIEDLMNEIADLKKSQG